MSKVWELIDLSIGDTVVIRVPYYHLNLCNIRCIPTGDDDVIILLDKFTSKFNFGPRVSCGST